MVAQLCVVVELVLQVLLVPPLQVMVAAVPVWSTPGPDPVRYIGPV